MKMKKWMLLLLALLTAMCLSLTACGGLEMLPELPEASESDGEEQGGESADGESEDGESESAESAEGEAAAAKGEFAEVEAVEAVEAIEGQMPETTAESETAG